MQLSGTLQGILNRALEQKAPDREEMIHLLQYPEQSLESGLIRAVANKITRERSHNLASIAGQIGYATSPCEGDCKFCVFGAGHTTFPVVNMSLKEVAEYARAFTKSGMLSGLSLMSIHQFDFARFLEVFAAVREAVPEYVGVSANVGDISLEQAKELKAAGVSGAYHQIRLREEIDTKLNREKRVQTVRNLQEAGFHWGFCCEPIGPEHTPEELADHVLFGMSLHPCYSGAMRRVCLPNSPLADRGQITELRLAQIVAVTALAAIADPNIASIGVHEPNLIGLTSGANTICAEVGANPRDQNVETSKNLGLSVEDCVRMVYEAGFAGVVRSDKEVIPISLPSGC
jgi:biotin synthase